MPFVARKLYEYERMISSPLGALYEISKNLMDIRFFNGKGIRFKGGDLSLETAKLVILFDESGTPCNSYCY